MKLCYDCRKPIVASRFRCDSCVSALSGGYTVENKKRRGLNEWEELKLKFYKSDKAWEENIRSRQVIEKNGKKEVIYKDRFGTIKPLPKVR